MEETQIISKKLLILNAVLVISIVFMVFAIYDVLNKPIKKEVVVYNQENSLKVFDGINLEAKSLS